MQTFEVSYLRLVTCFDQSFEGCLDQFGYTATQYGLLAKKVSFCFFGYGAFAVSYLTCLVCLLRRPDWHRHAAAFVAALSLVSILGGVLAVILQKRGAISLSMNVGGAAAVTLIALAASGLLTAPVALAARVLTRDPASGEKLWEYETANYLNATPAVIGDRIVFGGCDAVLHVVSGTTGKAVATVPLGDECHVASAPALDGERYGDAVVLARAAALRGLAEAGTVKLHRSKTDREYVRQAARKDPKNRAALAEVVRSAEEQRFGGRSQERHD